MLIDALSELNLINNSNSNNNININSNNSIIASSNITPDRNMINLSRQRLIGVERRVLKQYKNNCLKK